MSTTASTTVTATVIARSNEWTATATIPDWMLDATRLNDVAGCDVLRAVFQFLPDLPDVLPQHVDGDVDSAKGLPFRKPMAFVADFDPLNGQPHLKIDGGQIFIKGRLIDLEAMAQALRQQAEGCFRPHSQERDGESELRRGPIIKEVWRPVRPA